MKKIPLILIMTLIISMLAGCAGTPVVFYTECTCPASAHEETATLPSDNEDPAPAEGALKTGLAITTAVDGSKAATAEADGEAKYDVLIAAVLVDDNGVIRDCIIDGISASVKFNATGEITSDLSAAPQSKNELGDAYGMRSASSIGAEWNEQVASIAEFAVGKTVEQLQNGAISETGKAPEGSDLASSATMYMGSYVSIIEKAVANAQHLGAQSGGMLKLAAINDIAGSTAATAEKAGNAQLDSDIVALSMNGEVITSCVLDSVQAKIAFDAAGVITTDVTAPVSTKTELGENYGMVAWGKAIAEWDEQAAAFASYVTGKTAAEVSGIAVGEDEKTTDADLRASVTIKIVGYMDLIQKAVE